MNCILGRCRALEVRKPNLLLRLTGLALLRFGTRQFIQLLFELSSRFTRFVPESAVTPNLLQIPADCEWSFRNIVNAGPIS